MTYFFGRGESVCRIIGGLFCFVLISVPTVVAQTKQDEEALRGLPRAFAAAFAKHDAHELAQIMSDDVDFVTVGLNWLQGREVFEKYHERLLKGRFSEISHSVLDTHVRMIRPDIAIVRHSWAVKGDKNPDGSVREPRFGLMTMVAEKRAGKWLVVAVQNVNANTTPAPEAQGIKMPIVVPRGK